MATSFFLQKLLRKKLKINFKGGNKWQAKVVR